MNLKARVRRIVGVLTVLLAVFGCFVVKTQSAPIDAKAVTAKLFADYYKPGTANRALERAVATAAGKPVRASGCGEYECTWEFEGEQGCVGAGEEVWVNNHTFMCECLDAGECYMVPED